MSESKKPAEKAEPAKGKRDGTRETIESIVIAIIFAFLFRTFEAEAFVIPTGSMAPTLLGRHKDSTCPKCGFEFTVGASEELDRDGSLLVRRLEKAVCPNCRYRMPIRNDPVFIGDRILVTKFAYETNDPDRWDVTVFKFPEDPTTNYIKRLVGLPGETIEIRQGDLYQVGDGGAQVLRKEQGAKQLAVLQAIYDDNHPSRDLLAAGWPERWAAVIHDEAPDRESVAGWSPAADGWQADAENRSYRIAAGGATQWLRYRNFAPEAEDWRDLEIGDLDPRARLILDFCGYNALQFEHGGPPEMGVYWVGDLAVSARVDLEEVQPGGTLTLELVEGSRKYRCTLDPNAGTAKLSYVDALDRDQRLEAARVLSEAAIDFASPGEYEILFANVDDRLWLWIDGEEIEFEDPTYQPFGGQIVQFPSEDDLTPVGIAAEKLAATVSNLVVSRDVYYRAEFVDPATAGLPEGSRAHVSEAGNDEERLQDAASDPELYGNIYGQAVPWLDDRGDRGAEYRLALSEDEYLLLGDNSPRSQDSRLWGNIRGGDHRHAVPRSALVGEALLIFWPHGLRIGNRDENGVAHGYTISGLDRFFYHQTIDPQTRQPVFVHDYPKHGVPFYPNFERIFRRIR